MLNAVTDQPSTHTFYADARIASSNARILLTLNSSELPISLDNISVRQVQGRYLDREDMVFVTTNPSSQSKTIELDADYLDINGITKSAGTTITVGSFETLLLFPK